MSNKQYTPGPWKTSKDRVSDSKRVFIADAWTSDRPVKEREANARLIAAAPDLLEAMENACIALADIKRLAQQHDPATGHYADIDPYKAFEIVHNAHIAARAALAKAQE